eukprot:jgi/Mesen1/8424/ME000472S07782
MRNLGVLLLSLLAAATIFAGGAVAEKLMSCPVSPLDLCDFHFQGYHRKVPTFNFPAKSGDAPLSPFLVDARSRVVIEVDSSGEGKFLCPKDNKTSAGVQFYAGGQSARVLVRAFNKPAKSYYKSRCVLLPITSAQIPTGGYSPLNLNRGDAHQKAYPEARRCVVFKTGPNAPLSGASHAQRSDALLAVARLEELGEAVSDDNVAIALVDCTSSRDTCSQQGIRGYPTLKVLLNGKEHKKYEGARDFESLRTFITEEAKQVEQLATAAA